MREKDISRLLTDEYAERILVATHAKPRSVQDISDRYDIPIAACYRKVHELEDVGLLEVARVVTTPKGKSMRLYSSRIEKAWIVFEEGIFKARFEFSREEALNGKWVHLNAPQEA